MKYPNPYLNNINWNKIKDKHIYTILGVAWIISGAVIIYLLVTN